MTRAIEEIRECYKNTRSEIDNTVASYRGYKTDSPFVMQLEDILFLLDHIATLEAENTALRAQVGAFEEKQREAYQLGRRHAIAGEMVQFMDVQQLAPCYRCGGTGSITHFGEGADEGHDIDLNCPVCNPKYPPPDDDRDWHEPDRYY